MLLRAGFYYGLGNKNAETGTCWTILVHFVTFGDVRRSVSEMREMFKCCSPWMACAKGTNTLRIANLMSLTFQKDKYAWRYMETVGLRSANSRSDSFFWCSSARRFFQENYLCFLANNWSTVFKTSSSTIPKQVYQRTKRKWYIRSKLWVRYWTRLGN